MRAPLSDRVINGTSLSLQFACFSTFFLPCENKVFVPLGVTANGIILEARTRP